MGSGGCAARADGGRRSVRPTYWRSDVQEPWDVAEEVLRAVGHLRGHPAHPLALGLPASLRGADVVHTHHTRSAPGRVAASARRRDRHRALVTTDHGLGGDASRRWGRRFDLFLTVSRYSAEVLRAPPARTRLIYGGADPVRFHPDPAGTRGGVLFVGRLVPEKAPDLLLHAYRRVAGGRPLVVAG